ncbi:MAG TPA: MFS transporter, partial [Xanthobacteraceae bacterium]
MPETSNGRTAPLIVAVSLFMENMDSTVIATSLPAIARDIGTSPLALKLAVTSYLLSLAIFIPASGWTADHFGARNVFRAAIGVFVLGSIGCALSHSLEDFVIARIFQGVGGAMMTPVGRLIVVRSIDKTLLLNAMSLLTIPALIGPICGPPLGGFITTYATWHWIFIINVPIGLIGIALATRFIPDVRAEYPYPFDLFGFILSGLAIGGLAFGLSVMGLEFLPDSVVAALIGVGAICGIAYVVHARRAAAPILDLRLFKLPTFRASIVGGFMFRLGVGALPFLLPLLLQIGFGLTPFQSGLITFTSALGSMFMKAAAAFVLRNLGYRNVLLYNSLVSACFLAACASFVHGMPYAAMIAILLTGGFFRSLQFTSINTIAYAEVEPPMMSRATSMVAAFQQLSLST